MCLGIYIATDRTLAEVPWDPSAPAFNLGPLSDQELPVRAQFSLPHLYYTGAHTQCACGFSRTEEPDDTARRASLRALVVCLKPVVQDGTVELFVCWDGDYAAAPQQRLQLPLDELEHDPRWLEERSFVAVVQAAA